MKNKIITILIITCTIASINLMGCAQKNGDNSKEVEVVQTTQESKEKPEEFIEKMYKGLIDKKLTFENIWEDYFSDTSKNMEMFNKKAYVENSEGNDFKNNIIRTNIKVLSSEQVEDNIFKVKSILKYTINGQEKSEDLTEYVIKENNKLKYLTQGVISVEKHADTTIENIGYKNVSIINYVEGIGISIDIVNQSENEIALGWVTGYTVTLKTDKGEYSSTLNNIKIPEGQKQNIVVQFNNAEGTPKEMIINNINYLDNRGLPKDQTGGKAHKIVVN